MNKSSRTVVCYYHFRPLSLDLVPVQVEGMKCEEHFLSFAFSLSYAGYDESVVMMSGFRSEFSTHLDVSRVNLHN